MPTRRTVVALLALTVAATLAVSGQAGPTAAAGPMPPAVAWLQRSYGLTAPAAERRLAAEHAYHHVAGTLLEDLGEDATGAWLERETGALVVDIVDPAAMPAVRAANARPRLVARSAPALERVMQRLDAQAARHGSGRAVSWHVDLPANAVVVTVADDARHRGRSAGSDALPASDALLAVARTFGDAVRIHRLRGATTTQAGLRGGQGIETDDGEMCTGGFTATDRAGRPVLLTAGHCGKNASWFSRNGSVVGRVRAARFPGDDFAVVALDNIAQWTAQPSVERYGPSPLGVRGHSKAVVGSTVCKSGRRTGWTCGRVVAHDVTVSYDDGAIVSGLTQTSACSRRGDSGGPLMAGRYAQGMLSGGQTIGDRCLDRYGMQNVSVFQPVGEALSTYGLRLLTSR